MEMATDCIRCIDVDNIAGTIQTLLTLHVRNYRPKCKKLNSLKQFLTATRPTSHN